MDDKKKKQAFLKRLMETFTEEADEHIKAIAAGLVRLENSTGPDERERVLDAVYREVHSLKGAARSVDRTGIEALCQVLEDVFPKFKQDSMQTTPDVFDVLHQAVDIIQQLNTSRTTQPPNMKEVLQKLEQIRDGNFPGPPPPMEKGPPGSTAAKKSQRQEMLKAIQERLKKKKASTPAAPASTASTAAPADTPIPGDIRSGTIRLSTQKLDKVLLQSEEMLFGKLSLNRVSGELAQARRMLRALRKKIAPGGASVSQDFLKELQGQLNEIYSALETDRHTMGALIDTHLEDMKELMMMPFSTLTAGFPKTVRDLARDKGKEIDIIIRGAEKEIDKRVLEAVKEPLLHLLRNAADHGIEAPEERTRLEKPSKGNILLSIASLESDKVEIRLSDDGGGIDPEKIKQQCLDSGVAAREELEKLGEDEILDMIFRAEFSTSPLITDISGRGLGLAIAREKVEKTGGVISVKTQPRKGTTFRITLPLTLATFRGVLVTARNQRFMVPTINVERVLRVKLSDIRTVENRETILVDNRAASHVPLAHALGLPPSGHIRPETQWVQMLLLTAEGKRIAFSVDDVLEEEEVMVKSLGHQLKRVNNITGAAILSSNEVVPILNVPDLLRSAVQSAAAAPPITKTGRRKEDGRKANTVLLVEDSITSRILLKNILESAGYAVRVAVDGMAGWTSLKEQQVDAVISDVDMPRMDGFQLTAQIRGHKPLAQIPVVLVTGLEKREDREKGIEVGANAYIVKSSFDQSNLLGVLKRLL